MNRTLRHAIPNGLSVARLLLGLTFPLVPAEWRLWVVAVAALSDALDGLIARLLHAESDTGRMLDPVADKVFVLVLAGTLVAEGAIHPLWAAGVAARDIVVLMGLVVVAARGRWSAYRKLRPSWPGKCTTAAQFALLLVLVAWGSAPVWLLAAITLLSAAAAVDYALRFRRSVAGASVDTPR
jgi:phosphatidylglycerophosphate synthase